MSKAQIGIINWDRFQHYKNRNPPWIKLHRALLDNRDWDALSGDAAKLLVSCWLLASEYDGGVIPMDAKDLAWRLRRSDVEGLSALLHELVEHGFIGTGEQVASAVLARREQGAIQRREEERQVTTVGSSVDIHPLRAIEEVDPEHLITLAIRAANVGMTDNGRIDQHRLRPILPSQGKSRQIARDWLNAGYPWEAVLETVYFTALDYKPSERHSQILNLQYFTNPIRDRSERDAAAATIRPKRNEIHPAAEVHQVRTESPGSERRHATEEKGQPLKLARLFEEMKKKGFAIPDRPASPDAENVA